jgi:NADH:ubiquinone oxidoreductase subunit F (NADH-binding)
VTLPTLVRCTPRLLRETSEDVSFERHREMHGDLPASTAAEVLREIDASGLTGRGGAGFPTGRKLRSLAGTRRPILIGNGCEGEPASGKDVFLLHRLPHLVLDGIQLAARAIGASEAYLAVASPAAMRRAEVAVAERVSRGVDSVRVTLLSVPEVFLSGEESALVNAVVGRKPLPRTVPPRVFERGAFGRPTLVQNVETLAHIALIARFGATWFRERGPDHDPGTMLVSISGAVHRPGISEVVRGAPLAEIVATAGGFSRSPQAVLVGGYHGTWVDPHADHFAPGAGVVIVLPLDVCGLVETARVASYLAAESAGQCGPCLNGLPALADVLCDIASPSGRRDAGAESRVWQLAGLVERRGACHHPDGTARFVRSAMTTFRTELAVHAGGDCSAVSDERVLPTPGFGAKRR